ncbi:hypothetical protein LIER_31755 [Lithospermum erythrorhizon]|uniref:Reverse transcriptase n=1 Tax=Lithospermum erythrorhizon TaxID=34254 RepID=A0AAV3RVP7_LITER
MSGSKSPRPDGIPAKFFQQYWDTVGDTLCNMVLSFLNGHFLKIFNFTFITLIPKVEKPINMAQFRPIALCNTTAKVIAKVLAMRLKKFYPLSSQIHKVLLCLIGPSLITFYKGGVAEKANDFFQVLANINKDRVNALFIVGRRLGYSQSRLG